MKTAKHLGISLDYSDARLIEYILPSNKTGIIRTVCVPHQNEHLYHSAYYQKLSEIILHYEDVILFGSTDAKVDLLYFIIGDNRFAGVKIQIKYTLKMTENQKLEFVKTYFSTC